MKEETKTEFINNLIVLLEKYDVSIYATIRSYDWDTERREQLLVLADNKTRTSILSIGEKHGCSINKRIYKK